MTVADAKSLDINELLDRLGHQPTRRTAKDTWYRRPYGNETHASFHVSRDGRAWFDFGTGQGGNIIDLALLLVPCQGVAQALAFLESVQGQLVRPATIKQRPLPQPAPAAYQLQSHQPMADERGGAFLRSRSLDPLALRPYLTDVYFTPGHSPHIQPLYGIGLANASGGFELRSQLGGTPWRKLSLGPKDISAFRLSPTAAWLCFEGMPDFGSFLTVDRPPLGTFNYLILNGTGMTTRATEFLATQPPGSLILCSQAGEGAGKSKETLLTWAAAQGWQTGDIDHKWQGYGDYNEKLMANQERSQPPGGAGLKSTPKTGT